MCLSVCLCAPVSLCAGALILLFVSRTSEKLQTARSAQTDAAAHASKCLLCLCALDTAVGTCQCWMDRMFNSTGDGLLRKL